MKFDSYSNFATQPMSLFLSIFGTSARTHPIYLKLYHNITCKNVMLNKNKEKNWMASCGEDKNGQLAITG